MKIFKISNVVTKILLSSKKIRKLINGWALTRAGERGGKGGGEGMEGVELAVHLTYGLMLLSVQY